MRLVIATSVLLLSAGCGHNAFYTASETLSSPPAGGEVTNWVPEGTAERDYFKEFPGAWAAKRGCIRSLERRYGARSLEPGEAQELLIACMRRKGWMLIEDKIELIF